MKLKDKVKINLRGIPKGLLRDELKNPINNWGVIISVDDLEVKVRWGNGEVNEYFMAWLEVLE